MSEQSERSMSSQKKASLQWVPHPVNSSPQQRMAAQSCFFQSSEHLMPSSGTIRTTGTKYHIGINPQIAYRWYRFNRSNISVRTIPRAKRRSRAESNRAQTCDSCRFCGKSSNSHMAVIVRGCNLQSIRMQIHVPHQSRKLKTVIVLL